MGGRGVAAASGALHEQEQREDQEEQNAQGAESFEEREQGGLALDHAESGAVGLAGGGDGIRTARHQGGAHLVQHEARPRVVRVQVTCGGRLLSRVVFGGTGFRSTDPGWTEMIERLCRPARPGREQDNRQ